MFYFSFLFKENRNKQTKNKQTNKSAHVEKSNQSTPPVTMYLYKWYQIWSSDQTYKKLYTDTFRRGVLIKVMEEVLVMWHCTILEVSFISCFVTK